MHENVGFARLTVSRVLHASLRPDSPTRHSPTAPPRAKGCSPSLSPTVLLSECLCYSHFPVASNVLSD